jgi:hypothetical protein
MLLIDRIDALCKLGDRLGCIASAWPQQPDAQRVEAVNPWFTPSNIRHSLSSISAQLEINKLNSLAARYDGLDRGFVNKTLACVMAGNVPLAGWHDMLCSLLAGISFLGKMSSKDSLLPLLVKNELEKISPQLSGRLSFAASKLEGFDMVTATGSDNSARYFEYYFSKYPNIIRKSRSSAAVLTGNETKECYNKLADDVFLYFGLGCRSVSTLHVPAGWNPEMFYNAAEERYRSIKAHNKYLNNYEYSRAIFLIDSVKHLDNGFCILREADGPGSPLAVVNYRSYNDISQAWEVLISQKEKLQCVATDAPSPAALSTCPLGKAQEPEPGWYADGIDTIDFILLNS